MYIKWIVCIVEESQKDNFSKAQEQWKNIKNTAGFIGQIGGFNLNNQNEACIVSFWENEDSFQYFMDNVHDEIFFKNKQAKTYSSIAVNYYSRLFQMDAQHSDFNNCLLKGTVLRVAQCETSPNNKLQFTEDQKNVWKPGMKNVKGMLGGQFSIKEGNSDKFLVLTFWDTLSNHKNYVCNELPSLKRKSNSLNQLLKLDGKIVNLVDSWKIIGNLKSK